jgi:hypothetical protein
MPSQTFNIFDAVDEVDLSKIHVIIAVFFEYEVLVY